MIGLIHSNISDYQNHMLWGDGSVHYIPATETFSFRSKYNKEIGFGPWTAIPGAILAIYDPPGGLSVTAQYRRVASSSLNGVDCESALTNTVSVTVMATVTPGSIDADQSTTCPDGDPAVFFFDFPLWMSSITLDKYGSPVHGYGVEV